MEQDAYQKVLLQRIECLERKYALEVKQLQKEVEVLRQIADFYLESVPKKYRAFFREDGKLFVDTFEKPLVVRESKSVFSPPVRRIALPKDPEEFKKAKDRMASLLLDAKHKWTIRPGKPRLTQQERHRLEHPEAFTPKNGEASSSEPDSPRPDQ